jgi:hypothetical protein
LKVPAGALSLSDKEDRISQFAETLFVLITCNLLGRATNTRYPSISAETLTLHTFNQIEDQEYQFLQHQYSPRNAKNKKKEG